MKPTLIDATDSKRGLFVLLLATITSFTVLFSPVESKAAPGDLDTGFGTDGRFFTSIVSGVDAIGRGVGIQRVNDEQKIIVVGSTGNLGSGVVRFAVARLNDDGTLDEAFVGCDPLSGDPLCDPGTHPTTPRVRSHLTLPTAPRTWPAGWRFRVTARL